MRKQPANNEYKPLFNRTYLKYLGFVVAIAIIFLSEKPASPIDQVVPVENSVTGLALLQSAEEHPSRLLLSFHSTPALSLDAKIDRQLMYQSISKAAEDIAQVHSILWAQDRLEIELRRFQDKPLTIQQALFDLERTSRQYINEQARKLIAAELYLKNQSADNAALQLLDNSFARKLANNETLSSILNTQPKALLITDAALTDPQVSDIDQQLSELFHAATYKDVSDIPWRSFDENLEHRSTKYQLLVATELKQTGNENTALELLSTLVLSDLLQLTASKFDMDYRLVRRPISNRGYQALLLSSDRKLTADFIFNIKAAVEQLPIESALKNAKERLIDNYYALAQDPDRLFKLYSKKYFYGLTTQSPSEYEAQLDTISAKSIRHQINQLLGENVISIRLQPS